LKTPREATTDLEVLDADSFEHRKFCYDCKYYGHTSLKTECNRDAQVMLVGESPAHNEIEKMRNFVGDSGRLLLRYLHATGHHRRDCHIGNIIRCMIPANMEKAEKESLIKDLSHCCGKYIVHDIRTIKPKIVVLMGRPAINYFLQGDPSIKSVRGKVFYSSILQTYIICTYHPAAVMRSWAYEKFIIRDLEIAFNFVERDPSIQVEEPQYKIARSLEESLSLCEYLKGQDKIAYDVETDTLDWFGGGNILSWGFSSGPRTGITIPFTSIHSTPLNAKERMKLINNGIRPLLECKNKKIGQNILFDKHWAANYGIHLNNISFDTMLAHHLLDENMPHDLDTIADFYTDMGPYAKDVYAHLPNKNCSYNVIPDETLWLYGAKDCDAVYRLEEPFNAKLEREGLKWLYTNITLPMIDVIAKIEKRGVSVNRYGFEKAAEEAGIELAGLTESMSKYSGMGDDFNPNSGKQIGKILFETLGLKPGKKTKTGYSTDVKVLESLRYEHEFVELLMQYRKVAKFKSTYLDGTKEGKEAGLIRMIRDDGRIHTSYKIHGTSTGRLASANPNCQNIPRGNFMRSLFVAAPGFSFVIGDFERGELYSAAHLSRDIQLMHVLRTEDVHATMASKMFKKPIDQITKEERIMAKTIIFGILFGRGPTSIAKQLNISYRDAIKYIIAFFDGCPQLEQWIKRTHDHARRYGYVRNLFGRVRHLYGLLSVTNSYLIGEMLRQAQNMPVQGSLADAGHLATIEFTHRLVKEYPESGIVLLVHDELVVETLNKDIEGVGILMKEIFEKPRKGLQIPLEVLTGPNWSAK